MADNNGIDQVIFNTRERATSADVSSVQSNISESVSDILRGMYGFNRGSTASGVDVIMREWPETTTGGWGLKAVVLGGLMVNPRDTYALVDPGTLAYVATPDGDEGPFNVVSSPGLSTPNEFTFLANAGPGPRWDVLVATPTAVETSETVDIYDPPTKQWNPETLPKRSTTELVYSTIRGTVASPSPGPAAIPGGSQPLAVVWVPAGAVDFDDCEFFDVRPTVADLSSPAPVKTAPASVGTCTVSYTFTDDLSAGLGLDFVNMSRMGPSQNNPANFFLGGDIPRQYDLSGPLVATAPMETLSDGGGNVNLDPAEPGNPYMAYGDSTTSDSWYLISLVHPFGFARFSKFTNDYVYDSRRWPVQLSGLLTLTAFTSAGGTKVGRPSTSQLPNAYDTSLASGAYAAPIGRIRANSAGDGYLDCNLSSNGMFTITEGQIFTSTNTDTFDNSKLETICGDVSTEFYAQFSLSGGTPTDTIVLGDPVFNWGINYMPVSPISGSVSISPPVRIPETIQSFNCTWAAGGSSSSTDMFLTGIKLY